MAVDFSEGSLINNRYRILGEVGEGGMAMVYKAQDTLLERVVALKVLRPQYGADQAFVARFRREAQAAARLAHPNIVDVYDIGAVDGYHYIVMEYVEGQDLKNIIAAESPLPVRRAVDLGIQICAAVGHAHKMGIVHRDLKPHNILIMDDDRVKVTDFGIARAMAEASATATSADMVWGTAQYISPEQAAGQPAAPASDVYSLGVVLYEMLAGRLPFAADSRVALAVKHLQEEPPPLHSFNPTVPPRVEAIVAQAMRKDPARRYPNADALGQALRDYRRYGEEATGPLPRVTAPARPAERIPATPAVPPRVVERTVTSRSTTQPSVGSPAVVPEAGIDWGAVILGILAVIAVTGLIPLWMAVLQHFSQTQPPPTPPRKPAAIMIEIPTLVGLSQEEAQSKLERQGLQPKFREGRFDDTVPALFVLEQSLKPGAKVAPGTEIELTLSRGPNFIQVPPVVMQRIEDAIKILENLGLKVEREMVWSSEVQKDIVVAQDPPAESPALRGSQISLKVGSGPRIVVGAVLGDRVRLAEVELNRVELSPRDRLQVTLFWEVLRSVDRDYSVFVHLAYPDGKPLAQHDSPPRNGQRPTKSWQLRERITDPHELIIPDRAAAGSYELRVGLYSNDLPATEQRLAVTRPGNGTVADNSIVIRQIEVH